MIGLVACGTPAGPKPSGAPAGARKHSGRLPSEAPARAAPPSAVHVVAKGETIYRISKRYGSSVDAIVSANGIKDVHGIPIGTRLAWKRPIAELPHRLARWPFAGDNGRG